MLGQSHSGDPATGDFKRRHRDQKVGDVLDDLSAL
jgi:hypothetical protein